MLFLVGSGHHCCLLQPDQLPVEDFTNLARELLPAYSFALTENEEHLKTRLDAVGILLSYLSEEVRALREKHASWISSGLRGRPH